MEEKAHQLATLISWKPYVADGESSVPLNCDHASSVYDKATRFGMTMRPSATKVFLQGESAAPLIVWGLWWKNTFSYMYAQPVKCNALKIDRVDFHMGCGRFLRADSPLFPHECQVKSGSFDIKWPLHTSKASLSPSCFKRANNFCYEDHNVVCRLVYVKNASFSPLGKTKRIYYQEYS